MDVIKCATCDKVLKIHPEDHVDPIEFCSDECFDIYFPEEEVVDTLQIEEDRLKRMLCRGQAIKRLWRNISDEM